MQVRCPHCATVFPTSTGGVQPCPSCGREIHVPLAAPPVVPGSPREPVVVGEVAWERRRELGVWSAFWKTWVASLGSDAFWRAVKPGGPLKDALIYGWIVSAAGGVLSIPVQWVTMRLQQPPAMPPDSGNLPEGYREAMARMLEFTGWMREHSLEWVVGGALVGVVLAPLSLFLMSGIFHLFCLLFGAGRNGFAATFRAICYAQSPLLISFIPCVNVIAPFYAIALYVWGIARTQETTIGRAAAGVIVPFVLLTCCLSCGIFFAIAAIFGQAASS